MVLYVCVLLINKWVRFCLTNGIDDINVSSFCNECFHKFFVTTNACQMKNTVAVVVTVVHNGIQGAFLGG